MIKGFFEMRAGPYEWADIMKRKYGGSYDNYVDEYGVLTNRMIKILEEKNLPVGESLVKLGYLPSITQSARGSGYDLADVLYRAVRCRQTDEKEIKTIADFMGLSSVTVLDAYKRLEEVLGEEYAKIQDRLSGIVSQLVL